jgi:sporulation protein YlmC with PRC-barrel domain
MRADKLIGMRVYNLNGDEVGKVDDILFDKEGKITGVVLSVGGVFGIGSKAVGLVWKEVDVSPQQDTVQISYTKQQLESAPEFQRLEPATTEPAPAIPAAGGSPPAQ